MLKLHDVIVLEGSTFSKQDGQQSTSMKFPFLCKGGLGIDRRSMHRFCHDYVMSRKWSQMQWHGGGSWIWAALPFVWCSQGSASWHRLIFECFSNGFFLTFADFSRNSNILSPGGIPAQQLDQGAKTGTWQSRSWNPKFENPRIGAEGIQGRLVVSRFSFFEIMFKVYLFGRFYIEILVYI